MRSALTLLVCLGAAVCGAAEKTEFLTGGDVSALPKLESLGAVYKDSDHAGDAVRIMRDHGCTCFRVRLFVNPTMKEVVVQDLPFAIKLGQRIKATGASLLLDLHYSDTWADPQKQTKPAAWATLAFPALEKQVEDYSADVMKAFKAAHCVPDIVQVGNEITPGFLWPDGKPGAPEGGWDHFAALLKAGIRGVKKPLGAEDRVKLMIHADCGGDAGKTRWFFDHLRERQVGFDMIGLSYYPWWHGGLDKLRENLTQTAQRYGKEIVVVETAYPWRTCDETKNMNWPMTPQGQEQFLRELVEAVRATPNKLGCGVIWWYPESVRVKGLSVWMGGDVALFDEAGAALPAMKAFNASEPQPPKPCLGMNLSGPCDWNTELPFVDVFRLSRAWISQRKGESWGKGPKLSIDEHGWVRSLEPDCFAETPLCTIEKGHYPSGRYTVLYEGKGILAFTGAASVAEDTPNRMVIQVDAAKGGFFLQLRATDPADPVRNIRVIMPGFEATHAKEPFNPDFLARWRGVACLRFMDWMETNGSKIGAWSERPRPDDATFTVKGVPVEVMVDLCNRLKADAWFCMPHLADDDYVRHFAQSVKANLDPALKVYIEYSNEVWNGMFAQSKWAGEQGIKLGFAKQPWEAGWAFTAYRSVQIFRIWEEAFGGRQRLVRVLPTQGANPYVSKRILDFQDAYKQADALAIAPYMGFCIPAKSDKKLNAETVATWSVDQALDHMAKVVLPETVEQMRKQKAVADEHGLKLVCYEAGQHMVGVAGGENNEVMNRLFYAANANPRMGDLYRDYLNAWTAAGGDLLCNFSSVGKWSKWGSWGLLQYADEPAAQSPKYRATMEWAKRCGMTPGSNR